MKTRTVSFALCLFAITMLASISAYADDGVVPGVEGFTVGLVFDSMTSTEPGVRAGYWWQYFGVDLTLQGSGYEAEISDGADSITIGEETIGYAGLGLKVGAQIERVKVYGRLGLGSLVSSDEVLEVDLSVRVVDITLGLDFAVSNHLVLGINILEGRAISGTLEDASGASNLTLDLDGVTSRFLQGGHISFQF